MYGKIIYMRDIIQLYILQNGYVQVDLKILCTSQTKTIVKIKRRQSPNIKMS